MKPYVESLESKSNLPPPPPPDPPVGSNWGRKITDFVFWPYISFILAFRALECIQSYWGNHM